MTQRIRKAHLALADMRALDKEAERYNPVNPTSMTHYSKEKRVNASGSGATPSMGLSQFRGGGVARREALNMADNRAMEVQHNRENPTNPKQLMNNRKENANRLVGQGATPSMGLSQFRGGKHTLLDHLEHPTKGYGTKKGQVRKTARRAYEGVDDLREAQDMGRQLRDHLVELHGKGFCSAFSEGMTGETMAGGAYSEEQRANMIMEKAKPGRNRNNGIPLLSGNIDGVWSGTGKRRGRPPKMKGGDMLNQPMPVAGTNLSLTGQTFPVDENKEEEEALPPVNDMSAEMKGNGLTGAYEGQGRVKTPQQKRVVGAGVMKRAEIVKRIMKEKGMKLIEASKYVKAHNLY